MFAPWFGKGQNGRNNVITGANPKVEGLETAWAIEAPDAKTAAVVTSDGKTIPLIHIDGTPVFAATVVAFRPGRPFAGLSVSDDAARRAERGRSKSAIPDALSSRKCPVCPRAN